MYDTDFLNNGDGLHGTFKPVVGVDVTASDDNVVNCIIELLAFIGTTLVTICGSTAALTIVGPLLSTGICLKYNGSN